MELSVGKLVLNRLLAVDGEQFKVPLRGVANTVRNHGRLELTRDEGLSEAPKSHVLEIGPTQRRSGDLREGGPALSLPLFRSRISLWA
jgi:hypothetical protein